MAVAVGRLAEWWLGELAAMLPPALRPDAPPAIELALGPGGAELRRLGRGGARRLGTLDPARADAGAARRLLRGGRGARALVRLGPGRALRLRVGLPAGAAGDLRAALAAELDRHTPFAAAEACFDFRVDGADPDIERVFVEVEIARRADVEAGLALARRLGLRPARVTGAEAGAGAGGFDLTPAGERPGRGRGARLIGALALLLAVLAAGALAAWFDREARILAREEARVAELRAALAAASGETERSRRLAALAEAARAERAARPPVVSLLDEATGRLSDAHWAEAVEIGDGRIALSGWSEEAVGVIAELEASPLFEEARFAGPVVRDAGTGLERFEAVARIAGAPEPGR